LPQKIAKLVSQFAQNKKVGTTQIEIVPTLYFYAFNLEYPYTAKMKNFFSPPTFQGEPLNI
jgi:hypothetical protein